MDNSQDIRTKMANIDKQLIVDNLNELFSKLYKQEGVVGFRFSDEEQIIYVDVGKKELPVYVKGWLPAKIMYRIFDEVCGYFK